MELRQSTKHIRIKFEGSHPLFMIGRLMRTLGQYENAEHFYQRLAKQSESTPNNPLGQAKLYVDLETVYMDRCLYSQALSYFPASLKFGPVYQELNQYEQALTLRLHCFPSTHPDIAQS